jgi:hypothetical protein
MADLLRRQLVDDGWAWVVAATWDARAARVCCDTRKWRSPVGEVVRLPAGTVYQFRHLELQRRLATRTR